MSRKKKNFGVSGLLANATGSSREETSENPEAEPESEARKQKPVQVEIPSAPAGPPSQAPSVESTSSDGENVGEGHRKTSRGYVQSDGTKRKRKSLFLQEHHIQALEFLAMRSGCSDSLSRFIVEELNLDGVASEMGFSGEPDM